MRASTLVLALACAFALLPSSSAVGPAAQLASGNYSSWTYGELALQVVPTAYTGVIQLLPSLTPGVAPGDVKPVRKAILSLRNYVDIFSYAYADKSSTFKGDPLVYIRGKLDDGYETIGHFRDLQESGVNYTKKELVTRRCEVLSWEADFEEKLAEHDFEAYLGAPLQDKLETKRPKSHLSSFFWRDVGFEPSEKHTGMQTVVKLTETLLGLAHDRRSALLNLKDMTKTDEQLEMHAYRKLLRGILAIGSGLPVWGAGDANATAAQGVLTDTYDGLGNVEDQVNNYVYEQEHGSKKDQKTEKEKLDEMWKALQKQIEDEGLKAAIKYLKDNTLPY